MITKTFCILIVAIFAWFIIPALRVRTYASKILDRANESENPLEVLSDSALAPNAAEYRKTINTDINGTVKSNIPASEFFSEFTVSKSCRINSRIIDAGSGTLVGLGLLGTFIGLTLGIQGFDSSNSDNIQSSIQSLLDGMGTAFSTSLLGMFFSLAYTICEKTWRNGLAKRLYDLNQKLDDAYYIDDAELSVYNQRQISAEMMQSISSLLHYRNAEGHEVPLANAIREILAHNEEQTRALKSFSSDLALELNDRLDETLSRQMQKQIIPLMESVDATTKMVIEHIDHMARAVSSPATELVERMVADLKGSLSAIMGEFQSVISEHATNEFENLALTLDATTKAISDFPQSMSSVSGVLQSVIENVEKSTAGMSSFMQTSMEKISGAVQVSVQTMADDLTGKQTDLLALQEDTMTQMDNLLSKFNESVERMSEANVAVGGTMDLIRQAQTGISGTTAHLQTIADDMKTAVEAFRQGQTSFSLNLEKMQKETEAKLLEVFQLYENAGNATDEYVEKFEIIKAGLGQIFGQIQNGLSEYSRSVNESLRKYLDTYTASLTTTTDRLASTIEIQNEMVDSLVQTVNDYRKR